MAESLEGLVIPIKTMGKHEWVETNILDVFDEQKIARFASSISRHKFNDFPVDEALQQEALEILKKDEEYWAHTIRGQLYGALQMYHDLLGKAWGIFESKKRSHYGNISKEAWLEHLSDFAEGCAGDFWEESDFDEWGSIVSDCQTKVEKKYNHNEISIEHEEGTITITVHTSRLNYALIDEPFTKPKFEVSLGWGFLDGLKFLSWFEKEASD